MEVMLPVIGEKDPVKVTTAIHQIVENVTSSLSSAAAINMIAGAGLTGGGTLAANRTFDVGAGTGIAVNANDVALSFLGLQALTDPGADRILFWDDSEGAFKWLTVSTGLAVTTTNLAFSYTITDTFSVLIETVANQDYKIIFNCPFGGTINTVWAISVSGTATCTVKINTTALGGTASAVSSAGQTQSHSTNNVFVTSNDIVLTFSANAACLRATITIGYTRNLT